MRVGQPAEFQFLQDGMAILGGTVDVLFDIITYLAVIVFL